MKEFKLTRNNTYDNDILIVDGFGKSGKIIMERILELYEGIDLHIEDEWSQMITRLNSIKKIDDNTAIILLRTIFDRKMYNSSISREINTRFKDDSSIFKYSYPLEYLKRYFTSDSNRDNIDRYINDRVLHIASQNALIYSDILFKSFGDRLKIIYVARNPIEQVYSMKDYDFLNRIGNHPSNTMITYEYKWIEYPLFAKGWEDDFFNMKDMDRIIKWNFEIYKRLYKICSKIDRDKLMIIDFDNLVNHTNLICNKIDEFIDRERTFKLNLMLKIGRYPKKIDMDSRTKQYAFIIDNTDHLDIYHNLMDEYNRFIDKYEILQF